MRFREDGQIQHGGLGRSGKAICWAMSVLPVPGVPMTIARERARRPPPKTRSRFGTPVSSNSGIAPRLWSVMSFPPWAMFATRWLRRIERKNEPKSRALAQPGDSAQMHPRCAKRYPAKCTVQGLRPADPLSGACGSGEGRSTAKDDELADPDE